MSSTINTIKRKLDDGTIQEVFPRTPQQAVFNVDTGETLDDTISGLADEISLVDMRAAYELDIDGNNLSLIRTLTEETVSTVTIPGGGGGGTGDVPREEFDGLEQRVDTLEENVADLTGRVETLEENTPSNPEFEAHIAAKDNPHEVTKSQIGLGNVDNTSDTDKVTEGPIHDALELKANKSELESKVDKTELDKKADKTELEDINSALDTKVDSVKIGETEYKTGTTVTLPVYTTEEADAKIASDIKLRYKDNNINGTYELIIDLVNKDNEVIASSDSLDLPLETMVVNGEYENGKLVLILQNGNRIEDIDISSLVNGLVPDTRTIAGIDLADDITATELANALKDKIVDALSIPTVSASTEANEGNKIGSITIDGNTTEFYAPIDKDTVTTVTTTGTGQFITSISDDGKGQLTATKGNETQLSKGTTTAGTATTLTHGGKFKAMTKTAVSGHTITDTETEFTLPSETQLSKGTTIGSGNAVTDISVSNHQITLTKGKTFLEAHPTISTSTDTTSTETATHGGTVAMVDSVTRDSNGHVTKINTKTVTLPSDTKVTQTNTTTAADYRVLLSNSANDTTETNGARKSTNFTANPSTGAFYAKGFNRTAITGQTLDLDTLTLSAGSPEIMRYICKTSGGSNNITNIPVTGQPFILDVELVRWASATDYITKQTFISIGAKHNEYVRWCTNGTWETAWTKRVFNYSVATTSANGLMSSTDKTKLNATNIAYGTCSTEAATAAKVITISGNTNWALAAGSMITIKFSATNTAQNPTFNVNNTGAKSVWYNTAVITTGSLGYAGTANRPMNFIYDGTQYVFMGWSMDANSTYSNAGLGQGYGTCTTAEATVAKVVTLSGYALVVGGIVSVKFTYAVPASATMNINNKGAKNIFYRSAAIVAGIINAGDIATFIYDGTQYHLISIDKGILNITAKGALGYNSSTAQNLIPTVSTIAFWNGAYSGTNSNLAYCNQGAFGAAATKGVDTTVTSGSANLITSGAVYSAIPRSVATTSANGLMSKEDKTKLGVTNIAYGTCSTAADVAEKAVTISGNANWALAAGSMITIKFSATNTASGCTLNVNNTGAKKVWYNDAEYIGNSNQVFGYKNRHVSYIYDGTYWVWISHGTDINSTYSNASLGQGYGTCSTAADTVAKVVTLSNYNLQVGGIVSVKFTYAVPASATMNINSKGAKNIFYRGSAITANVIKAGDVATFIYDGTQYHVISVDRGINNMLTTSDVVDNVTSTSTTLPLSANQGNVLNTRVSSLLPHPYSLIRSLDIGPVTTSQTTYTTFNNRKISDYGMILITIGGSEDDIRASLTVSRTQFDNTTTPVKTMYLDCWSANGTKFHQIAVKWVSDTQIMIYATTTGTEVKYVNISGIKVDDAAI